MSRPRHLVLAALGSLGDLHPAMAIGLALMERGHRATLVTHEAYRGRVVAQGLGFAPLPPDLACFGDQAAFMAKVMHPTRGTEFVVREVALRFVREAWRVIDDAAADADALVGHPLTYAVPLVAERRGLPWAGTVLQPVALLSARDPSVYPQLAALGPLATAPWLVRAFLALGRRLSRGWAAPVDALRRDLGLPPTPRHPLFDGQFSPHLNLALFSRALAGPASDWPARTVQTGYCFYDRDQDGTLVPPGLAEFLDAGEPPVVFTLGSSAVRTAGDFYVAAARAAVALGRRAVLLVGHDAGPVARGPWPVGVFACPYAAYSQLFPRAAAVVHQGGAGTAGQALRAGRPMVIVPFSHDQFDQAARLARRGIAVALARGRADAAGMARALGRVLADPGFARRAGEAGAIVRAEDGARAAARALEGLLEAEAGAG